MKIAANDTDIMEINKIVYGLFVMIDRNNTLAYLFFYSDDFYRVNLGLHVGVFAKMLFFHFGKIESNIYI